MIPEQLEALRPKIKALEAIPTIPAIIQPLLSMFALPLEEVNANQVVELVAYDSAITAQCLRMANSPLFGRQNVATVRSAVLALGMKRMQAILLGCSLNRIVPSDQWALDAGVFWRHSLGCALVSSKMANLIGYPDGEKAYLAGLLHDLGILVNTLVCREGFRKCVRDAAEAREGLQRLEQEYLGFTHSQSGKMLAESWHLPEPVIAVIEFHHSVEACTTAEPLVSLVHLSDLLCRLRDLGYGYYEAMGVELAAEAAWANLVGHYPTLAKVDLARLTMEIDESMKEIVATVDAVFKPQQAAAV
jgi:putative nucleotidyltransferase with HDIG domain